MRFKHFIALPLSIVLILVIGSIPLSIASHSLDHHHHSAQTHTTGICAWMCTAAQTISTDSQILSPDFSLLEIIQPSPFFPTISPPQPFVPARAPPFWTFFISTDHSLRFNLTGSVTSCRWRVVRIHQWSGFTMSLTRSSYVQHWLGEPSNKWRTTGHPPSNGDPHTQE